MKAVLPRLISKPGQSALESLGVSLTDDQGNLRDIIQVYTEVANAVKNISQSEQIAVTEGLAGKYHISRMQSFLDDLGSADSMYKSMYESSKNSTGSAMDENEKYMQSLQARINLARVEVEKLALAFGEAFLTEGMIQGIKLFGDFLGAVAKLTETFGALPIVLSTIGVGVFALSSNFRALVLSIGASGLSFTKLGISAIKGNTQASTSTRTLTASVTQLTTAQRMQGQAAVNAAMATRNAGAAAATAAVSFRTMLFSLGAVGVVFAGIGFATEKLLGQQQKQRELQEKIESENRQLADTYKQNATEISALVDRYSELESSVSKGDFSNDTMQEYVTVQNELANLLPSLKKGENEHGDAILGNASIIQQRIDLLEKQAETQERVNAAKAKEENDEAYKLAQKARNNAQKEMDKFKFSDSSEWSKAGLDMPSIIDVGEIKNAKDVENALIQLTETKKRLVQEDAEGNKSKIIMVEQEIVSLDKQLQSYNNLKIGVDLANQEIVNSAMKRTDAILGTNQNITDSAVALVDNFQIVAASTINDTDTMVSLFDSFSNTLDSSLGVEPLEKFGSAMSELKEKQAEGLSTDELKEYEAEANATLANVQASFMKLAEASGVKVKSEEWNKLKTVFEVLEMNIQNLGMTAEDLAGKLNIPLDEAEGMLAVAASMTDGMGMVEESMDETADSAYELKDAIDELSGVSQQYIDDSDELLWQHELQSSMLKNLKQDTDEYKIAEENLKATKQDLMKLYPHLFKMDDTAIDLTDKKIAAIREEMDANDILRAALKASRDGQLTANEDSVLSSLVSTKTKIQHINEQIRALNALAQAQAVQAGSMSAAAEIASKLPGMGAAALSFKATSMAFKASSDVASRSVRTYDSQLEGLTTTQRGYIDTLRTSDAVTGNSTTRTNKAVDAAKKNAKAKDAETKAQEKNNEAIEKSIYLANKYEQALDKLALAQKKQEAITNNFPEYSDKYVNSLKKEIELQKDKKKLLEDQAKSLENQIKSGKIIRYGVTTTEVASSSSTSTKNLSGWGGKITSNYGYRTDPITGKKKFHAGTDLDGKTGTRLDSNVAGTVKFAGNAGNGFGNYVMVEAADGIKHIFAHLSKVAVKAGDKVVAGVKLGAIGASGRSRGSHLHYETRTKDNVSFDSRSYVNAAKNGNVVTANAVNKKYSGKYAKEINSSAKKYGVDPFLVAAIIKQESAFNPNAKSSAGARGLMQLMPATAKGLGVKDSYNAAQNIEGGTKYIAQQLKAFGGNIEKALAAYNAGPGNVRKYGGIPPFKETQNYVKKVTANYNSTKGSGSVTTADVKTQNKVSKDAAETKAAIDDTKAKVNGLKGQIADINELIDEMTLNVINSRVAGYDRRIFNYQKVIDAETNKVDSLDKASKRYQNSLERQREFSGYQKQVLEEQLYYVSKLIRSGSLSAKVTDEMNDKTKDLRMQIETLNIAMKNLTYEKVMTTMRIFEGQIDDVVYSIERLNGILGTIDEGTPEYTNELKKQIPLLEQQKKLLIDQRASLQRSLLIHDLTEEQVKDIHEQIEDLGNAIWGVEGNIKDMNKTIADTAKEIADNAADALIDAYKQYIQEKQKMHEKSLDKELKTENDRHEKVMKNYSDELDAFRKIVQERIDAIDKQESEDDYNKGIDELEASRQELSNKMNLLSLDNSLEAKAERKTLQEEIDAIDKDIAERRHQREIDLRKENLNEMITDKEEEIANKEKLETETHDKEVKRIEDLKEYWNQFYEDQLNDERHFAKLREDIVKGNFDNLSSEFKGFMDEMKNTMPDLENTLDGTMKAVGTSIRQNLIDQIQEALDLLGKAKDYTNGFANGGSSGGGIVAKPDDGLVEGRNPHTKQPTQKSALNQADLDVAMGKFLLDHVMSQETNPVRKEYIRQNAYDLSNGGRKAGSKIDNAIRFDQLVSGWDLDKRNAMANYMKGNGAKAVSTPALQDYIRQYADKISKASASYDTGGFTGSWGSSGKMATLHEEELVLNKKHTKDYFKAASLFEKLTSLISPLRMSSVQQPSLSGAGSSEQPININFNVENMNATKKEADGFASQIQNNLRRLKGMK